MYNIKVSVIIPVYNVEPYLKECLNSIINQTLKDIEIICIDDCSTDNSYQILEEYSKKDNRIIILKNEKNTGGPSTARNKGIDLAKGDYLYFIDSDDYIENNFLEEMYNTAKEYNTDIVSNLNIIENNNNNYIYYQHSIYNILKKNKLKNTCLEGKSNINIKDLKYNTLEFPFVVVWNKIYRKESIIKNNIRFLPYTLSKDDGTEDEHFFYQTLLHKLTFSYNHKAKYFYRKLNQSLVNSRNTFMAYYFRINNFIENFNTYNNIELFYQKIFNSFFDAFNRTIVNNTNVKDINKEYWYLHDIANKININIFNNSESKNYLLVKLNKTYENYLLQKQLFDNIDKLDDKINQIIERQNNKIEFFSIYNLKDIKIIHIFGIKITIKKKN